MALGRLGSTSPPSVKSLPPSARTTDVLATPMSNSRTRPDEDQ
jgi:hypothetical protein